MVREFSSSKLRLARIDQGVTQVELSRRTGIKTDLISRYENGHVRPHIRNLYKLAEALGVRPRELMDV